MGFSLFLKELIPFLFSIPLAVCDDVYINFMMFLSITVDIIYASPFSNHFHATHASHLFLRYSTFVLCSIQANISAHEPHPTTKQQSCTGTTKKRPMKIACRKSIYVYLGVCKVRMKIVGLVWILSCAAYRLLFSGNFQLKWLDTFECPKYMF